MAWIGGNRYLSQAEMENNAQIIAELCYAEGWTRGAIAAMLGNMQAESGINPGIWENLTAYGGGYGLVQWTPYTKYSQWALNNGYAWINNGNAEMARIFWESENNEQWFYNAEIGIAPPITFAEFTESELDYNTLSNYWLWFYEHPRDPGPATQALRQQYTAYWYDFIGDDPGPGPGPGPGPEPEPLYNWLIAIFAKQKRNRKHWRY